MPLFPLAGALLLPRRPIQLTVFEPRYLAMLDDALSRRAADRHDPADAGDGSRRGPAPELYPIGCAGRIVQYAEIGDGRCFLTLMGVARFRLAEEMHDATPYRVAHADYAPFAEDFARARARSAVDREGLLCDACARSPRSTRSRSTGATSRRRRTRRWSTALSMMSPCGPKEKQALLEAADLKSRAEMLVAITHDRARARRRRGDADSLAARLRVVGRCGALPTRPPFC